MFGNRCNEPVSAGRALIFSMRRDLFSRGLVPARLFLKCLIPGVLAMAALADDLPRGRIIDDVKCAAEPAQSYALYIPSNYTPGHGWSAIFAFDPRGRGRVPVERFRQAAEMYGYIVAGSNNSRNGSWE